MTQFSLLNIFTSMGFNVGYNSSQMLMLGYPDCTPMAVVIQINSLDAMNEDEIEAHLQIVRKDCMHIDFTIILNFGGFTCQHGNYKNTAFLLDRLLMEDMIRGKDIFSNILLNIIQEKGKLTEGSSLKMWAKRRVQSAKMNLPLSESIIFEKAGIHLEKTTSIGIWSNHLMIYADFINTPKNIEQMPIPLRTWAKKQFNDLEKQLLPPAKIKLMLDKNIIWSATYSMDQKYDELCHFIKENKRLPLEYECKLYRFLQNDTSDVHPKAVQLKKAIDESISTLEYEKKDWQNQLAEIVNEYKSVQKKIWKLSSESICWINSQINSNDSKELRTFKSIELSRLLKYTGEQYDYEWLNMFNRYSQLTEPPILKSEMWIWAVRQRKADIEKYKRLILNRIKFDFTGLNAHWYDCYERYNSLNPSQRKAVCQIGKDGIYWAFKNRKEYAIGNLSVEKKQLLVEINFDFKQDEFSWICLFEEIKDFYDIKNIGQKLILSNTLKTWCKKQRELIMNIDLLMTQTDKLLACGFIYLDPHFEEFILMLNDVIIKNDNLPEDFESYSWISSNPFRLAYAREVNNYLNPTSSILSNSIMVYFPLLVKFWEDEENRWQLFVEKIQTCANYVRNLYKKGELKEDMIKQLDQIGFLWDESNTEKWLYMLSKTKQFVSLYQHLPGYGDKDCYAWRFKQLRLYNANKLSAFKKVALSSIINTRRFEGATILN